jgi:CII-binding regulator of phage lambda lysogenization HflD
MSDISKRKHSDSSGSELDTSIQQHNDKQTIKQKKKKGKTQEIITEEIEVTMAETDIKKELAAINVKITNLCSGTNSALKQVIVDTITLMKDDILKSVMHKLDILEGKLFEKEKENDNLKSKINQLEKQLVTTKEDEAQNITNLKKILHDKTGQLNDLEQYGRRNNIRISGISESLEKNTNESAETTTNKILHILNEKFPKINLQESDIDIAHRLGKPKDGHSRPIIVKFVSRLKRNTIMSNRREFKGTDIFLNEDLTQINQKVLMAIKRTKSDQEAVWSWDGKVHHKSASGDIRVIQFAQYRNLIDMNM